MTLHLFIALFLNPSFAERGSYSLSFVVPVPGIARINLERVQSQSVDDFLARVVFVPGCAMEHQVTQFHLQSINISSINEVWSHVPELRSVTVNRTHICEMRDLSSISSFGVQVLRMKKIASAREVADVLYWQPSCTHFMEVRSYIPGREQEESTLQINEFFRELSTQLTSWATGIAQNNCPQMR